MMNFRKFFPLAFLTVFTLLLNTACNKDDMSEMDRLTEDTRTSISNGIAGIAGRTNGGDELNDCFQIAYPINVLFPDGTSQAVNSDEELYTTIDTWYENNEDLEEDPTIELPIMVTLEDGTTQTINEMEALEALFDECFEDDDDDDYGDDDEYEACFEFVYPFDIMLASGTVTIDSEDALETYLEDGDEDFEFVYPISVVLEEDGSTLDIADDEAFEDLLYSCWEHCDDDEDEYEDCFEFVYPFDVMTVNGTVTINNEDELEELREQIEENDEEFELVYPVSVVLEEDGSTVVVDDEEGFEELLHLCWGDDDYDDYDFEDCFMFVFPFDITTANGTITITDVMNLETTYEQLEEDDLEFELVFPLAIELLEDGSQVTINDEEELEELLETCD